MTSNKNQHNLRQSLHHRWYLSRACQESALLARHSLGGFIRRTFGGTRYEIRDTRPATISKSYNVTAKIAPFFQIICPVFTLFLQIFPKFPKIFTNFTPFFAPTTRISYPS